MAARTRFPHDSEYVAHLGAAVYASAYHEWLVLEVIRLLDPSTTMDALTAMTSGRVAAELRRVLGGRDDADQRIAQRLGALVDRRNHIIHAHPATAAGGEQRLYRYAPRRGRVAFVSEEQLAEFIRDVEGLNRDVSLLRSRLQEGA